LLQRRPGSARARALIVYAYRWDYRGKTRRKTAHCRASTVLAREYTRYPPTLLSSVVCCAVSSTLHHLNDLSRGPRNRERSRATRASSGRSVVKREIYVTQVQKGSLSLTGKSGLTRCKFWCEMFKKKKKKKKKDQSSGTPIGLEVDSMIVFS